MGSGPKHVLVVEDQPVLRERATAILNGAGYAVTAVDGFDAAIAAVREGAAISIVMTDLDLRGASGL